MKLWFGVECRSGVEYAERPLALYWQGKRLGVKDVLGSWRTPEGKCFRVSTQDDQIFELQYDQVNDAWSILQK